MCPSTHVCMHPCRSLHWMFGAYRAFLLQSRQRPYRASTTYAVPLIPMSFPIEAVLKILLPLCAIFGNLIGSEGFR